MVTRRQALAWIASAPISVPTVSAQNAAESDPTSYADQKSADVWMQTWIEAATLSDPSAAKAPNGALHVGRFSDPTYYLISTIGWDPSVHDAARFRPVRVPIGFVTDFTSIPRVFWSALRPDGVYSYAAVIHDYLYWEQYLPREDADAILKLCMEDFRINQATIMTIYAGVRAGGSWAWKNNAELKKAGERRVLRKTPSDPTISWTLWKQQSDVF